MKNDSIQNRSTPQFSIPSPLGFYCYLLISLFLFSCNLEPKPSTGSANAELSHLTLSNGTLTPPFSPGLIDYTATVPGIVDQIIITPTTVDPGATVTIVGISSPSLPLDLHVGENVVQLTVNAADGVTQKVYTVIINRALPLSSNANLSDLSLARGTLSPPFNPGTTQYTAEVGFLETESTVFTKVVASGATVSVNGEDNSSLPPVNYEVGENKIEVIITAPNSVTQKTYTIVVTRQKSSDFAEETYIKASTTGSFDQFGIQVALFENTLAVGAPGEDSNPDGPLGNNDKQDSGAVYIFKKEGTIWHQEALIKASNTDPGDDFGRNLALFGDTLAVSARLEDSIAVGINDNGNEFNNDRTDSGAVYVFKRNGVTWNQAAYIKASNPDTFDYFGSSVALFEDTLAVSALLEDSSGTGVDSDKQTDNTEKDSGAVYLFNRNGVIWSQTAYIKASNTEAHDAFGLNLALSKETLAVGAPQEDSVSKTIIQNQDDSDIQNNNGLSNSGAVYIFRQSEDLWNQEAYIKAFNNNQSDGFGSSISLYSNTSGDWLAIGAPGEDSPETQINGLAFNNTAKESGAVYLYRYGPVQKIIDGKSVTISEWAREAYIKAPNTNAFDSFGYGISLSKDFLAVSAYLEDSAAERTDGNMGDNTLRNSGAVYLFNRIGTSWHQQSYVKAFHSDESDKFGFSIALSGNNLMIGAPSEDSALIGIREDLSITPDNTSENSGAVYGMTFSFTP